MSTSSGGRGAGGGGSSGGGNGGEGAGRSGSHAPGRGFRFYAELSEADQTARANAERQRGLSRALAEATYPGQPPAKAAAPATEAGRTWSEQAAAQTINLHRQRYGAYPAPVLTPDGTTMAAAPKVAVAQPTASVAAPTVTPTAPTLTAREATTLAPSAARAVAAGAASQQAAASVSATSVLAPLPTAATPTVTTPAAAQPNSVGSIAVQPPASMRIGLASLREAAQPEALRSPPSPLGNVQITLTLAPEHKTHARASATALPSLPGPQAHPSTQVARDPAARNRLDTLLMQKQAASLEVTERRAGQAEAKQAGKAASGVGVGIGED